MSQTTSYRTEIVIPKPQLASLQGNVRGVPCMEIMRLAFEKIAREREGTLTEGYQDCSGKLHPSLLALRTNALPRGIGVNAGADGRVRFDFDRQGANVAEAEAIARDIARAYAVIALMRVQKQHGYQVSVQEETTANRVRSARLTAVRV